MIEEYVDMVEASTGKVLQVDADNDGVQELYFWIYDGGFMGNSSRYLLRGSADGTYTMTDASYIVCHIIAIRPIYYHISKQPTTPL